jgi:hypothetical protein
MGMKNIDLCLPILSSNGKFNKVNIVGQINVMVADKIPAWPLVDEKIRLFD